MKATMRLSGIAAIVAVLACGDHNKSQGISPDAAGAGGGSGGGSGEIVGTGGLIIDLSSASSHGGAPSNGGTSGAERDSAIDTGTAICGCGFSDLASCDEFTLWDAVKASAVGTVGGYCIGAQGMSADGAAPISGYLALDSDGRVVDNTVFGPAGLSRKQVWLDSLTKYRWPCLGGQTIPYTCEAGYE